MKKQQELLLELYLRLENQFKIIYPNGKNATYSSQLNYSDDLAKPVQRWYRYKEGYSLNLVRQLIKEYNNNSEGVILDPFLGSGTTVIAANQLGLRGVGFEVNPFSFNLSKLKLYNYTSHEIDEFEDAYKKLLRPQVALNDYQLPVLSFSNKVFPIEIESLYMNIKTRIVEDSTTSKKIKELLLMGWLARLEELSNYRKAGNGLKIRKYVKPRNITEENVYNVLLNQYEDMLSDMREATTQYDVNLFNDSSIEMCNYINGSSISGVIFSPPYANCFDYTEIYKLELWFGDFVKDYKDLKTLRQKSLRSHLHGELNRTSNYLTSQSVQMLLTYLKQKELWDKKIPNMLESYYSDMFNIIQNCYEVLEHNGFCSIVVGSSSYGDIIFPADLLLAEYAKSIGFEVDKIEVDRYLITSSQQYNNTKENQKYLRESVVCLIKK